MWHINFHLFWSPFCQNRRDDDMFYYWVFCSLDLLLCSFIYFYFKVIINIVKLGLIDFTKVRNAILLLSVVNVISCKVFDFTRYLYYEDKWVKLYNPTNKKKLNINNSSNSSKFIYLCLFYTNINISEK